MGKKLCPSKAISYRNAARNYCSVLSTVFKTYLVLLAFLLRLTTSMISLISLITDSLLPALYSVILHFSVSTDRRWEVGGGR